ncbi:MAG: MFS transporter [Candidatus Micrarchaeota archaeon]
MHPERKRRRKGALEKISNNTKISGLASFLNDASSEMIFPLLPFFLVNILGAPVLAVGLMESLGEFAMAISAFISGLYSDNIGARKRIIITGYSISAFFKGMLVLAAGWPQVILFKISDRIGKGVREPPRDALMALSEKKEHLGQAFGFRKLMDNGGAVLGPLIATFIIVFFFNNSPNEENYRLLFLVALVPSLLSVLVLFFLRDSQTHKKMPAVSIKKIVDDKETVHFALLMGLFALANFSMMFYLLRANEFVPLVMIPVIYLAYNAAYLFFAVPAGALMDQIGAKKTIFLGMVLFMCSLALMAFVPVAEAALIAFILAGCYMAIIETIPLAFLAKKTGDGSYAASIGFYRAVVGMAALPANLIAGLLWGITLLGSPVAFLFSLAAAAVGAAVFWLSVKNGR